VAGTRRPWNAGALQVSVWKGIADPARLRLISMVAAHRGTWAYFSLVPGALDTLAGLITAPTK
jgi:hypothetical protein